MDSFPGPVLLSSLWSQTIDITGAFDFWVKSLTIAPSEITEYIKAKQFSRNVTVEEGGGGRKTMDDSYFWGF